MEEIIGPEENYRKLKNLILSEDTANIRLGLELMYNLPTQARLINLLVVVAIVQDHREDIQEIVQAQLQRILPAQQADLLWENLKSYLQNFYASSYVEILYKDLLDSMQKFDFLDFNELCNTFLLINHRLLPYCIEKQTESLPHLLRLAQYHDSEGMALELQDCNLSEIPPEIGEFVELHYLNISRNPLTELPDEMAKLKNLRYLDYDETPLSENAIENLEKWFPALMADKYYNYYILKIFYANGTVNSDLPLESIMKALGWVDKCIRLDPQPVKYYNVKGVILEAMGRLKEGLECFEEALRLDPQNIFAHSNKAYNLFEQNQLEESLETAQKGLEVFSKNPSSNNYLESTLYFRVGQALYHLKRYEASEANYLKATQIDPDNGAAFYNLACIYVIWSQQEKVVQYLKTAIALDEKYFEEAKQDPDFNLYLDNEDFWQAVKPENE